MPPQVHPYSAARRPWRLFFTSVSLPSDYTNAMSRLRFNLNHFRYNYTLITLIIMFCTLVYHPFSMIVFLVINLGWMYLYFFREDPFVFLGKSVDDRFVLIVLSIVTVLALALTKVGVNVLVGLCVAFVLVGIHGVIRGNEDLFLDECEAEEEDTPSIADEVGLKELALCSPLYQTPVPQN